jgi:hypothetical protein
MRRAAPWPQVMARSSSTQPDSSTVADLIAGIERFTAAQDDRTASTRGPAVGTVA